jgi:2'-5' RNA ligase
MAFRAFIAVEVPYSAELEKFSKAVKTSGSSAKLVDLANIHITLKFLGDITEEKISTIENVMRESVSGIKPFRMSMKGAGAFPNLGHISVVWAGLEDADQLVVIAERLEKGLKPLGFEAEKRKFTPHVTVARARHSPNLKELAEVIRDWELGEFGDVPVDRIILKKSVLRPEGPQYSDISVVFLE